VLELLNRARKLMQQRHSPDGYNGIRCVLKR
jgi:hypothetical protein